MFASSTAHNRRSWRPPDYASPFEQAEYIARIPDGVRVRGVAFASFARALSGSAHEGESDAVEDAAKRELKARGIRSFAWYPVAELIDYGCTVGRALFPSLCTRAQMAAVWRTGFSGFRRENVLGRTLYALAGGTPGDLLRRGGRIYETIHSHARIEVISERANELVLVYRDHWVVPETAGAALLEGCFAALGFETNLWLQPSGPASGRVLVQWWPKPDHAVIDESDDTVAF